MSIVKLGIVVRMTNIYIANTLKRSQPLIVTW
jgi:hypothetical protein